MPTDLGPSSPTPSPSSTDARNADAVPVIDLSKMSIDKRAAMEVAESAREVQWTEPSFAQQLFMGTFIAKTPIANRSLITCSGIVRLWSTSSASRLAVR